MRDHPPRQQSKTGLEVDPARAAFPTLAENIATGVVLLDREGVLVLANGAARRLLGGPVAPERDAEAPLHLPDELLNAAHGGELDLVVSAPTAAPPRRLRARRLPLGGGQDGTLLLLEDIAGSEAARATLGLASRLRTWPLFRLVHELKQPLNALSLQLELLRQAAGAPDDGPPLTEIAAKAQSDVLRLGRELDAVSALLAPLAAAEPEPFDLGEVVADLLRRIASMLRVARISAELAPCAAPVVALARRDHVEQALLHVLQNAIEATPRGGKLRIVVRAEDGAAVVTIDDEGPGIPPSVLARAFELHYTTRSGAPGIGLFVARSLVEADGGRIELAPRARGGTRALITFPGG